MNLKAFSNPAGELVEHSEGYWYFIPNSPPSMPDINEKTVLLLSEANRKLGNLSGVGSILRNPHILILPYITKEAVLSSRIEGTQASVSDVFKFRAEKQKQIKEEHKTRDVKEVTNYVEALEYGLSEIERSDIDYNLIKEMHRILLSGVRGENMDPGEFRQIQNWIGEQGTTIEEATFVPPAPTALYKPFRDFIEYLNKKNVPLLIQTAFMHYHFECMHPFRDGNGRVGRLLITLFLCKKGALSQPLLYLSAYFDRKKSQYYRKLLEVSQKSKYEEWLQFFLKGVIEQSEDSLDRAKRLNDLSDRYQHKLVAIGATLNAQKLIDRLFYNPFITIPQATEYLKVTYPTAKKAIDILERAQIVEEVTGKERYKLYCAREILNVIEI
jgi:Fic family protein